MYAYDLFLFHIIVLHKGEAKGIGKKVTKYVKKVTKYGHTKR